MRPKPTDDSSPQPSTDAPHGALNNEFQLVFEQCESGLRRFLASRLSQSSDIDDCLQAVFVAMTQSGNEVSPSARTAWLFRVAANESAKLWRSKASTETALSKLGRKADVIDDPADLCIRDETRKAVQAAIARLPADYRDVVRLRMHEDLTFAKIAHQLNIPLGTALTRMRRALEQLRSELDVTD